ncbi:hypothetical protein D3C77_683500 [compost metagenome]
MGAFEFRQLQHLGSAEAFDDHCTHVMSPMDRLGRKSRIATRRNRRYAGVGRP